MSKTYYYGYLKSAGSYIPVIRESSSDLGAVAHSGAVKGELVHQGTFTLHDERRLDNARFFLKLAGIKAKHTGSVDQERLERQLSELNPKTNGGIDAAL